MNIIVLSCGQSQVFVILSKPFLFCFGCVFSIRLCVSLNEH